jgi:hypothetical protein
MDPLVLKGHGFSHRLAKGRACGLVPSTELGLEQSERSG